ncbi:MAG: hypothetical protein ABFE07_29065 [Armatimonadia bacterium]
MSDAWCGNCEHPEGPITDGVCAKCELAMRTCAFCGKVWPTRDTPGFDFYGIPYCLSCVAGRRPSDYVLQDGCHNCALCFQWQEYDCGSMHYCTDGAPPRPPSGSVYLKEHTAKFDEAEIERRAREWDMWSLGRQVEAWGKCGHWKLRKEEQT